MIKEKRVRKSWKLVSSAALVVLALGFFSLLVYGLANRSPVTGRSGETRVGKPAPDFSMLLLDGTEFRLSDHPGSPVVINFWASWCPPCRQESPGLERTWRRYREQGIKFVGVDIQDAEDDARAYVQEFGLSFPNGRDVDGRITVDYGVIGLPVTFFISSGGIVEGRSVGAVPEKTLESWVLDLISGRTPEDEAEGKTE